MELVRVEKGSGCWGRSDRGENGYWEGCHYK